MSSVGDIFGRRRMFLIGVAIFTLSSAAGGAAPGEALLVAGRAVQGLGGALMMPATLSIVTNAFPPAERGRAIGSGRACRRSPSPSDPWSAARSPSTSHGARSSTSTSPVAAGAMAMTLYSTHESRDHTAERRVDTPGIATLSVGLTALVLALVEGNQWGWGSPAILGLLGAALVALGVFATLERRVAAPVVDFAFFRSRSFLGANLVGFIVTFAMFGMFFFLALYLQNVLGLSPIQTGVRFLPVTIVIMAAATGASCRLCSCWASASASRWRRCRRRR